jgi:hypothetical protein
LFFSFPLIFLQHFPLILFPLFIFFTKCIKNFSAIYVNNIASQTVSELF